MSKPATISYEDRESLSVGVAHGDVKHLPKIAYTVNLAAEEAQEEYGKDAVLTVNGQPIDPVVGAAAVRAAYIKMHGIEPIGREWQGMLPVTKPFQTQERRFRMRDGVTVLESTLDTPREWNSEKLADYLAQWHPEYDLPRSIYPSHRKMLLEEVKKGLKMVGHPTKSVDVPWGGVAWPANDEGVDMTIVCTEKPGNEFGTPNKMVARFIVIAKKMYAEAVDEFYDLVMEEVRAVYKGKYLVWNNGRISYDDVWTKVRREELVFNEDMEFEWEGRIFGPIRNVEECRRIDARMLNRKFVFAGPIGTGKTMATQMIAQEAIQYDWTIVRVEPGTDEDYIAAMEFIGQLTGPIIVIAEDVDQRMPDMGGQQSQQQKLQQRSKLLDIFDGGGIKGKEIIFLLTTNFHLVWNSAMARAYRTDGFWLFEPLQRPGFERIMNLKLKGRLDPNLDWDALWEQVGGFSTSFLAALAEYSRDFCLGKPADYLLTTDDLAANVRMMSRQFEWQQELERIEDAKKVPTIYDLFDIYAGPAIESRLAAVGLATVK